MAPLASSTVSWCIHVPKCSSLFLKQAKHKDRLKFKSDHASGVKVQRPVPSVGMKRRFSTFAQDHYWALFKPETGK
jgi:hypothetical protein